MSHRLTRAGAALLSAAALAGLAPTTTAAQERDRKDCVVRPEPSGLIRGDQIPSGCLLQNEPVDPPAYPHVHWTTHPPLGLCAAFVERIDFTPTPKESSLVVMLKRCRVLLRAADRPVRPGGEDFESFNREFGSLERHFGSLQRHFGSIERHFGSLDRHFGKIERHFGRSVRSRDERGGG